MTDSSPMETWEDIDNWGCPKCEAFTCFNIVGESTDKYFEYGSLNVSEKSWKTEPEGYALNTLIQCIYCGHTIETPNLEKSRNPKQSMQRAFRQSTRRHRVRSAIQNI